MTLTPQEQEAMDYADSIDGGHIVALSALVRRLLEREEASNELRPSWAAIGAEGRWRIRVEIKRPDGNRVRQDIYVDPVVLIGSVNKPKKVLFDEGEHVLSNVVHMAVEGPYEARALTAEPAKEKS